MAAKKRTAKKKRGAAKRRRAGTGTVRGAGRKKAVVNSKRRPRGARAAARSEARSSEPNEDRKDWEIQSIFHFTVNATNFERSLAFYQTIGFKLLRDNRDIVWPDYV